MNTSAPFRQSRSSPSSRLSLLGLLLITGLILSAPTSAIARPKTSEEITFAALQGRVWILALVDFLHDAKLSEKDRKAVYSLYLYHELKVAGLESEHAAAPRAANTEIYQRTLGAEFQARLTQSIRVPFERPYIENPSLKATEPQKVSIEVHFRKLVEPFRATDKDKLHTPEWLTEMELSSVLIKDLKASLREWHDGKIVDEDENEILYEAVEKDLERVIDRIDEDEDLIDEAWKIAATEWLGQ
ncbi:hypothetical protein DES53_115135 [Roseimicrobium gellanilyticum]|uniref:Uncharacterized protein n=1 Tax=Roseimicrobium gellanilyticum TaxID=748857 RepID=A0A366H4Q3_9BACT|nr:hypothetical protein [Roseimicrobium gellanilyticum]RBP36994.1 hypothetical protein DES53_115135 [Roseimicrobium gellanilyticum]